MSADFDIGEMPDIRQRRSKDPDAEDAREVHDPHTWDDDSPGLRDRLLPDTASQGIGIAAVGLVALAFLWYFGPLVRSIVVEPIVIAAAGVLTYSAGLYVKGRQDGVSALRRLDKSILYYGDDADIRFCSESDVEGRVQTVSPIKRLRYGALRSLPLTLSDLPMPADKLKSKQLGDDEPADRPVRDRLNLSTVTKNTDTFGTVHITHASGLEYDDRGRRTDRYALPPHRIDEDVADEYHMKLNELKQNYQQLEHRLELLKQANRDMQSLRDSQTVPEFERMMDSMEDLIGMLNQPSNSKSSSNGSLALKEAEARNSVEGDR